MISKISTHLKKTIIILIVPSVSTSVVNLKIIQMNEAASKLFNMPKKRRLIGKPVSEIMDDYSLASILAFERNLMQDEIYLEDQKCYLDRVMTNDKEMPHCVLL